MKKLQVAKDPYPYKKPVIQVLHDSVSELGKIIKDLSEIPENVYKKNVLKKLEEVQLLVSRWRYAQQDVNNDLRTEIK